MSRRILPAPPALRQLAAVALGSMLAAGALAAEPNFPITPQQRATAQQAAEAGVPLSELLPNAPDIYTVKRRDTLWGISKLYLKSPWRWPELWGMNLEQVRNPHLIFPGQVLFLDKSNGRARLRMGAPGRRRRRRRACRRAIRSKDIALDGIASIPFNLIEPFLNEAVIFETNELAAAPRIVATQEGRVLLSRGDTAYVRGEIGHEREFRIFREPRPLKDPTTKEILGYEATYVGASEYTVQGETRTNADGKAEIIPATFTVTSIRQEAGVGDRLAPVPAREYTNYAPHPPAAPIAGQIVSIYGDALTAGQNQIVALNKGAVDGIERGHVLALYRDGKVVVDPTEKGRTEDQAARRAARRAVRVPRLQPHVVRADPVGEGAGRRRRPLHAAVDSPRRRPAPGRAEPAPRTAPGAATPSPRRPCRHMIDRDEFSAWLRLLETPGVGRDAARALLARFGSPEAVLARVDRGAQGRRAAPAPPRRWRALPDEFETRLAAALATGSTSGGDEARDVDRPRRPALSARRCSTAPTRRCCSTRAAGSSCSTQPAIAIVGSRNATPQGLENARAFAAHLSRRRLGRRLRAGARHRRRGARRRARRAAPARSRSSAPGSTASIRRAIARSRRRSPPTACWSASSPSARRRWPRTFRSGTASSPASRAARWSSRPPCNRAR